MRKQAIQYDAIAPKNAPNWSKAEKAIDGNRTAKNRNPIVGAVLITGTRHNSARYAIGSVKPPIKAPKDNATNAAYPNASFKTNPSAPLNTQCHAKHSRTITNEHA